MDKDKVIFTSAISPSKELVSLATEFLMEFKPLETLNNARPFLMYDEKSQAFYLPCHIKAIDFCDKADFNASIDEGDDEDLYKLNRDVTENESAYAVMVADAKAGRTFEDIVVEFDKDYNKNLPLKIYGGQHRIRAIQDARNDKPDIYHGFRVYFCLSKHQKVEIATINNTSIAVSNDLLDRMKEQLLGDELRDYFQLIGLLLPNQDFSDKKDSVIPTVRVARTFVVNYWKGKNSTSSQFHIPIVCKSGGLDEDYINTRHNINWSDADFVKAGKSFAELHQMQRAKVTSRKSDSLAQFASKAISLAVVASWSYASGMYSSNKPNQTILFNLTNNLGAYEDPLNAKGLSEARLKGIDTDTYRGLGSRINPDELGRMLEVFIVLVEKATEKKITKTLANAAIQSFEAKKSTHNAAKLLSKI